MPPALPDSVHAAKLLDPGEVAMAACPNHRVRLLLAAFMFAALAGCANAPRITVLLERPILAPPRAMALALDEGETLPLGITPELVGNEVEKAGFVLGGGAPRYRLTLTAAAGALKTGSYLPTEESKTKRNWIARPNRSLRARLAGGQMLRITAVLIDGESNKEVWRGTGTLRTHDPRSAASGLARDVLAKLPHG